MFVIKKLRLNKFVARPIVSNRALFHAMGEKPATIQSKETAECYDQPTAEGASKTKILGLAEQISRTAYLKHVTEGESNDMKQKNAKDY